MPSGATIILGASSRGRSEDEEPDYRAGLGGYGVSRQKGQIVPGTILFQDHGFAIWPIKGADVETVFEVEWRGNYWECKADGYGHLRSRGDTGEYGNGSIFVRPELGVTLLPDRQATTEMEPMT